MQIFDENGTPVQPEPRVPEKGAIMQLLRNVKTVWQGLHISGEQCTECSEPMKKNKQWLRGIGGHNEIN